MAGGTYICLPNPNKLTAKGFFLKIKNIMIRGSREKKIAEKGWPPDSGTRKADGCLMREEKTKCLPE